MAMLEIIIRVTSVVFIGLSFIGWIVFVIGFAGYVKELKKFDKGFDPGDEPDYYPFWTASVVGPVVHILTLLHALLFPAILRGIPGSITAILFVMYMSAVGFSMVWAGIIIGNLKEYKDDAEYYDEDLDDYEHSINLLFSGGFLTTIFLAVHLALWPWFKFSGSTGHSDSTDMVKF